jgi:glycine/D-amino acid oxidase-like deaminating enzyme
MQFSEQPGAGARQAVQGLRTVPFWLDSPDRPTPQPPLSGVDEADLVIVGGGFTGLWTALLAKPADPERRVVLLEGGRIAEGATGRNGGFVSASLTHGLANGAARFGDELPTLLRLGRENFEAIEQTVREFGIECDFRRAGELDVAVTEHQASDLRDLARLGQEYGEDLEWLDQDATRALVDSPTYVAGLLDRSGVALVDPARLAWGLAAAMRSAGVVVHEGTPVTALQEAGARVRVMTPAGSVVAPRVALATNAYPPLLSRLRHYIVPVYDYVLVTEPLSAEQWGSIGWSGREGLSDAGNRFHYYRVTPDGRILWGGYDAVHHFGSRFERRWETDSTHLARIAEHFHQTFPSLRDLRFTHGWGGVIDTCSRFSAFWGTALSGKVGYVLGFTGLGVGASRFGALTMLDLLEGRKTERTRLRMVRTKPLPFPPEPLRSMGISITTRSLTRADVTGRRDLWLRTLDRLGMGFDS